LQIQRYTLGDSDNFFIPIYASCSGRRDTAKKLKYFAAVRVRSPMWR